MNQLIPFKFQGVQLKEACWIEGKPHFTYRSIGVWLDYKNPYRAIHFIVERNPHIKEFSTMFKMNIVQDTGAGQKYEREMDVEVVDPIGLQLIINKSNQPKALAFQIAVAHMVVAYMKGELLPVTCVDGLESILAIPKGRGINQAVERLATERGCCRQTVYIHLGRVRKGEPIYKAKMKGYIYRKYAEKYKQFLELIGMNGVEQAKLLEMPISTIYRWRKTNA